MLVALHCIAFHSMPGDCEASCVAPLAGVLVQMRRVVPHDACPPGSFGGSYTGVTSILASESERKLPPTRCQYCINIANRVG